MADLKSKKVFFVIGEESGDALGADLLDALEKKAGISNLKIIPVGLAGEKMSRSGMVSLFDVTEIAVMGITAVLGRLPTILRRILNTVAAIEKERPDMVVLIDSPDFTHAVAKRVRKKLPGVPIIDYVCPSVWAWRSGRAKKMNAYIDHVLALLAFEPDVLKKLGGPDATYIGHRLVEDMARFSRNSRSIDVNEKPVLLVLPGSRRSELKSLLKTFGETVDLMHQNGTQFECVIPAVSHLEKEITIKTAAWRVAPTIVTGEDNKQKAFARATAALAVSGTVSLELALAGVPMVLAYKLEPLVRPLGFLISTWSAALPNLIADYVVVPEELNEAATPERLSRQVERLLTDTPQRRAQIDGLQQVRSRMQVDQPPGEKAADVVLDILSDQRSSTGT